MGNQAVQINPPNAQLHLTTHGSDWLWAAFSIFALSLLIMVALDFMRPRGTRLFHQIAIVVLATATIAYFSMASDLGATPVRAEFRDGNATRQIWFVRYIQWFITFPLLLLELPGHRFISLRHHDDFIHGHCPRHHGSYRRSCSEHVQVGVLRVWYLRSFLHLVHAPLARSQHDIRCWPNPPLRIFAQCWMALIPPHPVPYLLGVFRRRQRHFCHVRDGWYGILDILAGPVFLFVFLWHLRTVDYAAFGLRSGKYTDYEKGAMTGVPGAAPGTSIGAPGTVTGPPGAIPASTAGAGINPNPSVPAAGPATVGNAATTTGAAPTV